MGIRIEKTLREPLIFTTMLLMLAGLFTSRIILSVSMGTFVLLACVHQQFPKQLKSFIRNPFLLGMSLLFFIPLITGLYTGDIQAWIKIIRIKLPLLLLPLAFSGYWRLTSKQRQALLCAFLFFTVIACCWSLWQYAAHSEYLNKAYLQAKVIPTALENDHVRFSWVVSVAVMTTVYALRRATKKMLKAGLLVLLFFFIVYLHILSARTGLISMYLFLIMLAIEMLSKKENRRWVVGVCALVLILPLGAWFSMPTFRNRIHYLQYDYSVAQQNRYLPGMNDGSRINSLKAGWEILKNNPAGVGAGDVKMKADEWYNVHVPGMIGMDKLLPSSEWLVYGDSAGWAGILLFTVIMLLPFLQKMKQEQIFWIALNSTAAFSFLFDIGLEVQFGVFAYSFFVLCGWRIGKM